MTNIVFDTDPGIDDAIAILLALASTKEINVEAICTVNGNSPIDTVTRNACRILELAGRADIPVYRGSEKPLVRENLGEKPFHGPDGLGSSALPEPQKKAEKENAVDYLVSQAKKEKGELTVLAIGPLTNIARCVKKDKDFASCIKELVIMGAAEFKGNRTPYAEFNWWKDPEAADIVMKAGFKKITLIGLEATGCVTLTPALRELLYLIDTPVSREMHHMTRTYADNYWKFHQRLGCELCDVVTTAFVLDQSVCDLKEANVEVILNGKEEGRSVVRRISDNPDLKPNCRIAVSADSKKLFTLMFEKMFPDYADYIVKENLI